MVKGCDMMTRPFTCRTRFHTMIPGCCSCMIWSMLRQLQVDRSVKCGRKYCFEKGEWREASSTKTLTLHQLSGLSATMRAQIFAPAAGLKAAAQAPRSSFAPRPAQVFRVQKAQARRAISLQVQAVREWPDKDFIAETKVNALIFVEGVGRPSMSAPVALLVAVQVCSQHSCPQHSLSLTQPRAECPAGSSRV